MKENKSSLVYQCKIFDVWEEEVSWPNGKSTKQSWIDHNPTVAIVAINDKNEFLLIKQYRSAVKKNLLEIPAGGVDPGEDAETAVKREMQEETGYLPQNLENLGGYYLAPGYSTEYLYLYLVSDLVPSRLVAEDTEGINVVRVPVSQIRKLLRSGRICDGKSIAGLYMFLEYQKKKH